MSVGVATAAAKNSAPIMKSSWLSNQDFPGGIPRCLLKKDLIASPVMAPNPRSAPSSSPYGFPKPNCWIPPRRVPHNAPPMKPLRVFEEPKIGLLKVLPKSRGVFPLSLNQTGLMLAKYAGSMNHTAPKNSPRRSKVTPLSLF